ncbi:hypothetical protein MTQ16_08465, partial [Corynebacterium bovis]
MDPATAPLMIILDRRTPGPGDCFRPDAPVTVPLCPGLAALVTAGGRPVTLPATGSTSAWTVWDDAARAMLAHLADLTAAHGSALRRRTLDGAAHSNGSVPKAVSRAARSGARSPGWVRRDD